MPDPRSTPCTAVTQVKALVVDYLAVAVPECETPPWRYAISYPLQEPPHGLRAHDYPLRQHLAHQEK